MSIQARALRERLRQALAGPSEGTLCQQRKNASILYAPETIVVGRYLYGPRPYDEHSRSPRHGHCL